MKQCKVCGTLVHIDSNTCPSCGNHNFFVLDVKICPLCGKVNTITSSFCEQCGKSFTTAQKQGVSFNVKKHSVPPRPVYRERPPVREQQEQEKDYEIEKPTVKMPLSAREYSADRAYKDFMALKPQVIDSDGNSEYAYFVKGDADKLPVIILPKFAKTQGKNILVNIVIENGQNNAAATSQSNAADTQESKSEDALQQSDEGKQYSPFSAINDDKEEKTAQNVNIKNQEAQKDDIIKENKDKDNSANDDSGKESTPVVVKKRKKHKTPVTACSITYNIIMILLTLGLLASFSMLFYTSTDGQFKTAGLSPVLYTVNKIFNTSFTPPFYFADGFAAFQARSYNNGGGQFLNYAHLIPYIFTGIAVLSLFNLFILIFTFRHRRWAKVTMFITGLLSVLALIVIGLSIEFVYKVSVMETLGIGLIIAFLISIIYFVFVITSYKPEKD